jgi:hypothetical protein
MLGACCHELLEFLREADLPVMLGLSMDVRDRGVSLRYADGKRPEPLLPRESAPFRERLVHPFRRARLQQLNSLRHRNRPRQGEQHMNVVGDTSYRESRHTILAGDAAEVGVEAFFHFLTN